MKNYILAVLALGTGLALAIPASAEKAKGPCAADAAKFCRDVKPGDGRVAACLKEHEAELSQACKDRKALGAEKRGKRTGRGAAGGCLREYGKGYSSGFKSGFRMRQGLGRDKARQNGGKVCAADAEKLCKDVKPGEGRVRDCLIRNAAKLTDGCKTRVERMKERLEEKGKKV